MEQNSFYVAQKQKKSWFNDAKKDEMKAFVGALFFMAIHRQPNFEHYFSRDWVFTVPAIQNVFTRSRFWQLWQNFYLTDNSMRVMINCTNYDQ